MKYDLSKMDDRVKLLMIQPTLKHRLCMLWIMEKRYPKEISEIKKAFEIEQQLRINKKKAANVNK